MNKIIAVVGMCGSGKSIASDYYEKLGFKKVYFGGVTMEKVKEAGLPVNESNERMIRENLRKEYGMGAYAIILLPRIEEYAKEGNVILDGLYSWDELKILKDKFKDNLVVLAIVVNKKERYNRLLEREIRPLNNIDAEKRDIAEIENLAKGGPIVFADYYILNNNDMEKYISDLDEITKEILS
ncbi:MAG: AAA family ATPase [Bacilli bacterium]|nr:AAA family ATPase [Bacilli bacterium]MBQ6282342.1 AAA family ATPase [Bacilli bacterium]